MAMDANDATTPDLEAASHPTTAPDRGVPLWRFSLKGLFILVTILSVLFAMIGSSSFAGGMALVVLAVLVAAHVLGAAVGARLCAAGSALEDRKSIQRECGTEQTDGERDA